jgi:NADPH-dependent 2,4-dienoyl-CoA reductase/sulfur reductase-like enzyme
VGASRAGLSAASVLRSGGLGGTITLVGAEATLPYDKTHLSKQALGPDDFDLAGSLLCEPEDLDGVDLRLGTRAVGLDVTQQLVALSDGTDLGYDNLIVATGAAAIWPRELPRLGGVHVLRDAEHAAALRTDLWDGAHVVVVGGGFIGTEVAIAASGRGARVTIVELGSQLLMRALGAEVGAAWTILHRAHGVDVRCGERVVGLEGEGRVTAVLLSSGARLPADAVVIGVGAVPATDWLRTSGLPLDGGLLGDAYLQVTDGVYAAGDVALWPNPRFGRTMRVEHWTNAHDQGRAVAENIMGAGRAFSSIPYVWSDQWGRRIQVYGDTASADRCRVLSHDGEVPDLVLYGRGDLLVGALGVDNAKNLLPWRRALAQGAAWAESITAAP